MKNQTFVLADEIVRRLHVTPKYVKKMMLPQIKHWQDEEDRTAVDEGELRAWLMANLSFTRQTALVPYELLDAYLEKLKAFGIGSKTPPAYNRRKLPFVKIAPFDIWDEPLVFPDDERFAHAEQFYRAMYACGAVKIKFDERKAMFYAPALSFLEPLDYFTAKPPFNIREPVKDLMGNPISNIMETKQGLKFLLVGAELCPAVDDAPFIVPGTVSTDLHDVTITIKGERKYLDAITDIFRNINESWLQIEQADKETKITLPNFVLDEWMGRIPPED